MTNLFVFLDVRNAICNRSCFAIKTFLSAISTGSPNSGRVKPLNICGILMRTTSDWSKERGLEIA